MLRAQSYLSSFLAAVRTARCTPILQELLGRLVGFARIDVLEIVQCFHRPIECRAFRRASSTI
jgi:hypothetical protein